MNILRHLSPVIIVLMLLFVACEKPDIPVTLPPSTGAEHATVNMGEDYTDQVFFDLESKSIVYTSLVNSWDLAFEAQTMGYHVFINGGKNIFVHNTHVTDFASVKSPPAIKDNEWGFDASCGLPDSTAIGEWKAGNASKNEVYIIKLDPSQFADTFKKIQLLYVTDDSYVMQYGDLKGQDAKTITIPKNNNYNCSYFSFAENGVTHPEPPRNTWDIVFTRYRYIYHYLNNFPYSVTGALINPYSTTITVDSTIAYENIKSDNLQNRKFTTLRDVIGFSWKSYNIAEGKYTVKPNIVYIIKSRQGQYWKLHFLDFYSKQGVKGSPSFEYERLQ